LSLFGKFLRLATNPALLVEWAFPEPAPEQEQALVFDRDGNVRLNFGHPDVIRAFDSHLDRLKNLHKSGG